MSLPKIKRYETRNATLMGTLILCISFRVRLFSRKIKNNTLNPNLEKVISIVIAVLKKFKDKVMFCLYFNPNIILLDF